MDNHYGIIYCILNTINNHKYIGQTIRPFKERMHEHHVHMTYKDSRDRAIYKAMRKYGEENFKSYVIDTASNQDELDSKETFWIGFYNTFQGKGYNMTSGGQNEKSTEDNLGTLRICSNKEFLVFDINGKYLFNRKSQTAFAKEIGCEHGSIGGVLRGRKASVKGYILIYKDKYTEDILNNIITRIKLYSEIKPDFVVFNENTGEVIGIWNVLHECEKVIGWSRRMISDSLRLNDIGINHRSKPYRARYLSDLNDIEMHKYNTYKEENGYEQAKIVTRYR